MARSGHALSLNARLAPETRAPINRAQGGRPPGDGLPVLGRNARTRHALRAAAEARRAPLPPPRPVRLILPKLGVPPRYAVPLPAEATHSYGALAEAWAVEHVGLQLLGWQRYALRYALACSKDGTPAFRHVLVSTARQNGKSTLVRALLDWSLMLPGPLWQTVIGLAYDRRQAARIYHDVLVDVEGLGAYVTMYNGIRGPAGTYYDVASREARNNLRGLSVDLAVFDEVATHATTDVFDALLPTMATRPTALLVGLSTAGSEHSVLLRDWYDTGVRAAAGGIPIPGYGMLWWAAPEGASPDDPAAIAAANPSLRELLQPRALAYERARLGDGAWARERLNLWTVSEESIIPGPYWHARTDPLAPHPGAGERVALAIDTGHGWQRATIVVAHVSPPSGLPHVRLATSMEAPSDSAALSPSTVVAALRLLVEQYNPERIVYDAGAPIAAALESAAIDGDWPVVGLASRQMAGAAANLEAHVLSGDMSHDGSLLFAQQLAGAGRMKVGDGWKFSRRASVTAIDAIVSASMALYALTRPGEVVPTGPFIG